MTSRAQEIGEGKRESSGEDAVREELAEAKRCVEALAHPQMGDQHVDMNGYLTTKPSQDVALMFGQLQEILKKEAGWRGVAAESQLAGACGVGGGVGDCVGGRGVMVGAERRLGWVSGGAIDVGGGVFWGRDRGDAVGGDGVAIQGPKGGGVGQWVLGVMGGIGVPLMLVGLSAAGVGGQAYWEGAPSALTCLVGGAVLVSPLLVLLGLLMRDLGGVRLVLMAGSAGLVGNLLLELHCAVGEVPHLLLGHVMLSILLLGAGLGWSTWGRHVRGR